MPSGSVARVRSRFAYLDVALLLGALWLLLAVTAAQAQPAPILLEGEVPEGAPEYLLVPFEVPEGIVELEFRHRALPSGAGDILDFGLWDPQRFRGYGGGNTEPAILGVEAASRSYLSGPLPAGTWRVLVGKAKLVSSPARYRVELHLRSAPSGALSPQPERRTYVPAAPLRGEARWYAGDFHVHSRESGDARPTLDEIASYARGRGLDFVVVTDHNTVSHLDFMRDAQSRHPELLLLPGVEFTTYRGHANGIGAHAFADFRLGLEGRTINDAARELAEGGAVFSINHPMLDLGDACIGCKWEHGDSLERSRVGAVEIQTGAWSVTGAVFGEAPLRFWDAYCARGLRVAAVGGSDDHRAGVGTDALHSPIGSPTTLVWADELSENAVVEAVRRGRTVVKLEGPDDPMVELIALDAATGELRGRIGDTVRSAVTLRLTVTGGAGRQLRLVHDGRALPPVEVTADPFVHELAFAAPVEGEQRVRAEVLVEGKPRTVTSHLWLAPAQGEPLGETGCGCTSQGAGGAGFGPWLLLGIGALWTLSCARRGRTARAHRLAGCGRHPPGA